MSNGLLALAIILGVEGAALGLYWLYLRNDLRRHRKRILAEWDALTADLHRKMR